VVIFLSHVANEWFCPYFWKRRPCTKLEFLFWFGLLAECSSNSTVLNIEIFYICKPIDLPIEIVTLLIWVHKLVGKSSVLLFQKKTIWNKIKSRYSYGKRLRKIFLITIVRIYNSQTLRNFVDKWNENR